MNSPYKFLTSFFTCFLPHGSVSNAPLLQHRSVFVSAYANVANVQCLCSYYSYLYDFKLYVEFIMSVIHKG